MPFSPLRNPLPPLASPPPRNARLRRAGTTFASLYRGCPPYGETENPPTETRRSVLGREQVYPPCPNTARYGDVMAVPRDRYVRNRLSADLSTSDILRSLFLFSIPFLAIAYDSVTRVWGIPAVNRLRTFTAGKGMAEQIKSFLFVCGDALYPPSRSKSALPIHGRRPPAFRSPASPGGNDVRFAIPGMSSVWRDKRPADGDAAGKNVSDDEESIMKKQKGLERYRSDIL